MKGEKSASVPKRMRPICDAIMAITDTFCNDHLNAEYGDLCRRLITTLGRRHPSPLAHGEARTWACGIVYAIGRVNFLTDKTQTPHMSTAQLCELFTVGKSTGSAKANLIMNMCGMALFDPMWCLPSRIADNPLAWMIKVNGLIVDARCAPREVQEIAFRRGLIPGLPS